MADVRLDFYDLDDDVLPDVCMRCSAPVFGPADEDVLVDALLARMIPFGFAFMKRRHVPIPLCERHKNHWMIRYLFGFGGLALLLVLLFGAIALLVAATTAATPRTDSLMALGLVLLTGAGVVLLAWLITMIVLAVTQINVFEITDDSIVLTNISPDFTQAYREQRQGDVPDVDDMAHGHYGMARTGRRPDYDDPRRGGPPDLPPDDKYTRG